MGEPENNSDVSKSRRLLRPLGREPLVHFLVLAGLLFLAQALLQGDQREPIHIDLATQQFLVQQEADLNLRPLTEQERQAVIGSFVDEEILFREAKTRGFENSSRVRRLLVQNMRFFLASDPPAPTEAELRAYFTDNPDAFSSPATLTLENVFFVDPASITPTVLERLKAGAGPGQLGDDTPVTEFRLYSMDRRRLAAYFGPEGAPPVLFCHGGNASQPGPRS